MPVKKLQQGGVFPVNIPTGPAYNIPAGAPIQLPNPIQVDVKDMVNLAYLMRNRKAQEQLAVEKEAKIRELQQQAAIKLQDALFGPVDNQNQLDRLQAIKKKYNIPENLNVGLLDSPVLLKDLTNSMQRAVSDPDFVKIQRERLDAENFFTEIMKLNDRDATANALEAYTQYQQWGTGDNQATPFNTRQTLVPGLYAKAAQKGKQTNLSSALFTQRESFLGYDLATDEGRTAIGEIAAYAWANANEDDAVNLGLIEIDALGVPHPTVEGQEAAMRMADSYQRSYNAKQEAAAEQKRLSDELIRGRDKEEAEKAPTKTDIQLRARTAIAERLFRDAYPGVTITGEIRPFLEDIVTSAQNPEQVAAFMNNLISGEGEPILVESFRRAVEAARGPASGGLQQRPQFFNPLIENNPANVAQISYKEGVDPSGLSPGAQNLLADIPQEFEGIVVTDTVRTSEQNAAAGGSDTSFHLSENGGRAVDIRTKADQEGGQSGRDFAQWVTGTDGGRNWLERHGYRAIWEDLGGPNEHLHLEPVKQAEAPNKLVPPIEGF